MRVARPPFDDLRPTVEWQVNGHCNYDCTYCIQSRKSRVGIPETNRADAIIQTLGKLPGNWEIKMSGGEPFANPHFVKHIIPALIETTPHRLSVLTNLSAPVKTLQRFCEVTGPRLRITSASIHLEFEDAETFIDKAAAYRTLRETHNPNSSFVVNSVVVPGKLREQLALKERLNAKGFRYFPQLMKIRGGVYPYSGRDKRLIEELTGGSFDPKVVNRAPSYEGVHCEAGAWYFVVDQTGDAYSCRTGKRFSDADEGEAYLGNLADGTFRLRKKGGLCPYPICPCTVPALRGVIRFPQTSRLRASL